MSYVEKEKLIKADIASIENKVRHAFNQGYNLGYKDGKENSKDVTFSQVIRERNEAIDKSLKLFSELNKIKSIVTEWNNDTWSDLTSYDCMIKITDIINNTESENKE